MLSLVPASAGVSSPIFQIIRGRRLSDGPEHDRRHEQECRAYDDQLNLLNNGHGPAPPGFPQSQKINLTGPIREALSLLRRNIAGRIAY